MYGVTVSQTYYGPSYSGGGGSGPSGGGIWDNYGPSDGKFGIDTFPGPSGGGGNAGSSSTSGAAPGPPAPPPEISKPLTGRVRPNAQFVFLTYKGETAATGTAQELLSELQKLFGYNESRT